MEIKVRKARCEDIDKLAALFDKLNDYLEANENLCGWKKGVYPTKEDAKHFYDTDTLYVSEVDSLVTGSIAITQEAEKNPDNGKWQVEADDEVFVVRLFALDPDFFHKGISGEMLNFTEKLAREQDKKAIRLDVYEKNIPAIKVYEKNGYNFIDKIDLGLGAYGLDLFCLYEKVLV